MGAFIDPDSPVQPMTLVETDTYFDPSSVLFDYEPGDDLIGFGATFARASVATYVDVNGVVQTAASGVARDGHYIGGVRTLLLEDTRTNICLQSENFGTTWVASGTPTRSAAAHTASGITLDLIGDDSGAAREGYSQVIAFTGNAVKAISLYLKQGTSTSTLIELFDSTAPADRLVVSVSWSAGLPVITGSGGSVSFGYQALADGVFRILLATTSVTAANVNTLFVWPASDNTGAVVPQGTVYAGGVQAENAPFPSSYIKTTTVSVARSADSLSFPFTPAPQAMTMYAKVIEQGSAQLPANSGVAHIGPASSFTGELFSIIADASGHYAAAGSPVPLFSIHSVAPAIGNSVDLRALLYSDGSVQFGQSINGGAEVLAARSAAGTLGGSFGAQTLYVNSFGTSLTGFSAFVRLAIATGNKTLDVFPGKRTLYWTGAQNSYRTLSTDTPPSTLYRGRLTSPGVYTYDLIASWSKGVAQFGIGSIELANSDGGLDTLRSCVFDGYAIRFYSGTLAPTGAMTRQLLFQGVQEQPDVALDKVIIPIRSQTYGLDKPILSTRFLGTGTVEGNATIAGTIKPRVYGFTQNIPLIPVDPANLVYFVADRTASISTVYDEALALIPDGSVLADVAALYAASSPAAGHWIWCANDTEGTLVRLGLLPAGQVCADVFASGGLSNVVPIVLADAGAVSTIGAFGATYGLSSTTIGDYVTDDTTTFGDVLAYLTSSLAVWMWFNAGFPAWILSQLPTTDTTVASVSIGDSDITEMTKLGNPKTPGDGVPPWSVSVAYSRNFTVQTDGIAGTATLDRRNFLSQEQRSVSHNDARLRKIYPLAETVRLTGNLVDQAHGPGVDAQSFDDDYFAALTLARDWYQLRFKAPVSFFAPQSDGTFTQWIPAMMPAYGSAAIGVRSSRFGFTTSGKGTNFVPMAAQLDLATNEMTVIGWTTYRSA